MTLNNFYIPSEKYVLLHGGTGDTINNLLAFVHRYETASFTLIAPLSQKKLIEFVLELFGKNVKRAFFFDSAIHGVLNLWKNQFPSLRWTSGMPENQPGELCDLWSDPYELPRRYPVSKEIVDHAINLFRQRTIRAIAEAPEAEKKLLLPDNSVIFFPATSENCNRNVNLWHSIANYLQKKVLIC